MAVLWCLLFCDFLSARRRSVEMLMEMGWSGLVKTRSSLASEDVSNTNSLHDISCRRKERPVKARDKPMWGKLPNAIHLGR